MNLLHQFSDGKPFHISIGALLVNDDGNILVHRRTEQNAPKDGGDYLGGLSEAYTLMRESLENDESIETALRRGLKEEFNAEGEIIRYLGSVVAHITAPHPVVEKTTLYYQVRLKSMGERTPDDESWTELIWMEPRALLDAMRTQVSPNRPDLNESKIVEAYLTYGV